MIKLSRFTEDFKYPAKFKAKLSTMHSDIIQYIAKNYVNSKKFKNAACAMLNTATAVVLHGESCDMDLSESDYTKIQTLDADMLRGIIDGLYYDSSDIEWDMSEIPVESEVVKPAKPKTSKKSAAKAVVSETPVETPKEALYLRPPVVPRFDVNKPWLDFVKNGERYTIYTTLPIIPTIQNEISVTTDINLFTDADFMRLFPNRFIRTRNPVMYEQRDDLPFDPDLGVIIPVEGYTQEQLRTNIIEYPHFYKLIRFMDNKVTSFYSQIEIDGELYDTMSVWDDLPDSKLIPRTSEYIKEYVVRRYILECEAGVEHKYPMYGTIDKFLTLFTTAKQYADWGYDPLETAKSLIKSRVGYHRSRNPMIRKCLNNG